MSKGLSLFVLYSHNVLLKANICLVKLNQKNYFILDSKKHRLLKFTNIIFNFNFQFGVAHI